MWKGNSCSHCFCLLIAFCLDILSSNCLLLYLYLKESNKMVTTGQQDNRTTGRLDGMHLLSFDYGMKWGSHPFLLLPSFSGDWFCLLESRVSRLTLYLIMVLIFVTLSQYQPGILDWITEQSMEKWQPDFRNQWGESWTRVLFPLTIVIQLVSRFPRIFCILDLNESQNVVELGSLTVPESHFAMHAVTQWE